MRKRPSRKEVEREIASLDTLDTKSLQEKWAALYGRDPPSRIRADAPSGDQRSAAERWFS
ncbi:MAG: hypothetical protein ABS35_37640 [Kaistia sp. SCN 65-12]|nr:MAG: hypothetical protein ABS35_37640 [Kaistia sp. SCN 65-12]